MNLSIAPVGEICKSVNACSRIKSKLFVYDVPNIFKYVVFISPGKKKRTRFVHPPPTGSLSVRKTKEYGNLTHHDSNIYFTPKKCLIRSAAVSLFVTLTVTHYLYMNVCCSYP